MANVSARPHVFSRGSTVLDYWLAHAEGLTVQPLGARVVQVVVTPPAGRAEALIVRSPMTRRRKKIPADSIAAVEPSAGNLLLDRAADASSLHVPRPSPERLAAARVAAQRGGRYARTHAAAAARATGVGLRHGGRSARRHTAAAARATGTGTRSAVAWARPRAVRAGTRAAQGAAWLAVLAAPRAPQGGAGRPPPGVIRRARPP